MKKALFLLVKSMLRGEKRAFNIINQKYSKSKLPATVVLYNILDSEKIEYSDRIETKFTSLENAHRFPITVNQLFGQLLYSLRDQASKNRHDFAVSKYLDYSKILVNRGLFEEAFNQLKKAKKLCVSMDYIEMLPSILNNEIHIQQRLLNTAEFYTYKLEYHQEYEEVLNKMSNILEYDKLTGEIYSLYRTVGASKKKEDMKKYDAFLNSPLLTEESLALSINAKIRFHIIHNLLNNVLSQLDLADYHISRLIEIYETNKNYLRYNLSSYLSIINNALFTWSAKKEYDKFLLGIHKIQSLDKEFPDLEIYYQQRIFEISCSLELEYCIINEKIIRGEEIVEEIEVGFKRFPASGITIFRILGLSLGNAFLFFKSKQYEKALDWVNRVLKYDRGTTALHIIGYAKLMHLMIHLTQKDYDYLINIEPTTRKWLRKKGVQTDYQLMLLNFIKKHITRHFKAEKRESLDTFLVEIKTIPRDHLLITHFDVENWAKNL